MKDGLSGAGTEFGRAAFRARPAAAGVALVFLMAVVAPLLLPGSRKPAPGPSGPQKKARANDKVDGLLRQIHREVSEIGRYPGEPIVRREFFIGVGDDDTYKDSHLVVLIQDVEGTPKMTIQVTPLHPSPENPRVKFGREVRMIVCLVGPRRVELSRCDYAEKELPSLLRDMLRVIRERKDLFRRP
jgi:hypothetical protein